MGNPLNPVYDAVAWVFTHIYNVLSPVFGATSGWTWALTIVILVVLMRLIMVPLFIKQMHTTRAMTSLAPQMSALRKKYKNDKQTLNQETMKLYQQAGVNPLMGCLPVIAQLPMFFALFSVLKAIAEWVSLPVSGKPKYGLPLTMVENAKHASILGANVADKVLFTHALQVPVHAKVVIVCAVLLSMVTTYLTVRQSMKRGMMPTAGPDNPMGQSQKYMVYIMPFFALSGLYWPFGLVLYWVTTNFWTLGQQFVLFRRFPQPGAVTADAGGSAAPGLNGRSQPSLEGPTSTGNGRGPRSSAGPASPGSAAAGSGGTGRASTAKGTGSVAKGTSSTAKGTSSTAKGTSSTAKGSVAKGTGAAKGQTGQNGRGPVTSPAAGQSPAAGGGNGMLRRFTKGRSEPEPQPAEPEVKLVRQQPQRQSRSKRSGKR